MTNEQRVAIERAAHKAVPDLITESRVKHVCNRKDREYYKRGMQEVIEHPERYELYTKERYQSVKNRLRERRKQIAELIKVLGVIHNITTDDRVHELAGKAIGWEETE